MRLPGLCLLLAGCAIQGIPFGNNQQPQPEQPEPELPAPADECGARGGFCIVGDGKSCGPGMARAEFACGSGICCVSDRCASQETEAACDAARCRWVHCPPEADCFREAWCAVDCRTTGCAAGRVCDLCWTTWECLDPHAAC